MGEGFQPREQLIVGPADSAYSSLPYHLGAWHHNKTEVFVLLDDRVPAVGDHAFHLSIADLNGGTLCQIDF